MLFNLTSVRAMFTLVRVFMLLNYTSIRATLILVSELVMIYILVLIWKLPNYSTIQKPYYRLFPYLTMADFTDMLRPKKFFWCAF
jgi:hypothetical protein